MKHLGTEQFYNEHAEHLIDRYEKADMSTLHNCIVKNTPPDCSLLDIGFGSGRDLQFLHDRQYDIWGIDPTVQFVENAKSRFADISDHFYSDRLPLTTSYPELNNRFDAIIVIAVWMHLPREHYLKAVEDLVALSKPRSTIIISYSSGNRGSKDGRYFAEVDQAYLDTLFEQRGYKAIETVASDDSLQRNSLQWITVVYRHV